MFRLRRWEDGDHDRVVAIRDAVYPEYQDGCVVWPAAHQLDAPRTTPHRLVVAIATTGAVIAYAGVWPWDRTTGRYRLDLIVHPRWQRRGAGDMLLTQCQDDLRDLHARTIQARVRDDHPEGLAFLQKRGFAETQRMHGLALDLEAANADLIRTSIDQVAARGIVIRSLAQIPQDGDTLMHQLHDLHDVVLPDWPDPDPVPARPVSFDDFSRHLARLSVGPADVLVASERDRYVGYCILSFGTAVHPSERGRGIATALKACAIERSKRAGVQSLFTCTASSTMRHVNEKLGYRHVRTEIRLVKHL